MVKGIEIITNFTEHKTFNKFAPRIFLFKDIKLDIKELLEFQPELCLAKLTRRHRKVDLPQGLVQRKKPELLYKIIRERFRYFNFKIFKKIGNKFLDRP